MVEIKVPNKLPMKASLILETEKNPSSTIEPCTQNHDKYAKETEFAEKMKQSQSIKGSSDHDTLKNPTALASSSSPNYMKSTRCSEARKEKIQVPKKLISSALLKLQSRSFNRSSSLRKEKVLTKTSTATCSSALKDGKFPPFLDLNPGGTESQGASVVKVCHYNHCSLNEHKHEPNSPLKSFLSSKRKVLREQRIMKKAPHKEDIGVDSVAENEIDEGVPLLSDFLVEIYVNEKEDKAKGVKDKESDEMIHGCQYDELFAECSDEESEEEEEEHRAYLTGLEIGDGDSEQSNYESDYTFVQSSRDDNLFLLDEDGVKKDDVGIAFLKEELLGGEELDEFSGDEITDFYVQFSDSESSANCVYEDETQPKQGCSDEENTEKSLALSKKINEASEIEDEKKIKDSPKSSEETFMNEIEISRFTMQASSQDSSETGNPNTKKLSPEEGNQEEINTCKTWNTAIQSRKQEESLEATKSFNPREPNYLEVEADGEAEKVDLRHLEMDERRNAKEWMLDYALSKAVDQLAQGRKRKVSLMVEAFEKVMPPASVVQLLITTTDSSKTVFSAILNHGLDKELTCSIRGSYLHRKRQWGRI
ncbi:hypothetical protein V2J09_003338 [Rumex salicifolius]